MENKTNPFSGAELEEAIKGYMVALVLIGVVLMIAICLGVTAIYLIYRKLKQHEKDILRLQDVENTVLSMKTVQSKEWQNTDRHGDSAFEMASIDHDSDSDSINTGASWSRDKPYSGSHMSVKIRQEKTNVYGHIRYTSQVIMAAQNYYKSVENTDDVVPPECVQVFDKHNKNPNRASNVFTNDWRQGKTTSMLLDGFETPVDTNLTNNKAMFIHKTVNEIGGKLKFSGITLSIPKGALNNKTLITLGIVWEERFYPPLGRKSLLSPIILCQPSGLKFNIPVTLTFPHCAENVLEDWNITIMKRENNLNDTTRWTEIGFNVFSERDIAANTVSVKLDHFTLYTCVGESRDDRVAAKAVHLVSFVSQLTPGSLFKPRIYCLNNYREELQNVEFLVAKMAPGAKISETSDLIVHDNNEDLVVKLGKLSDKWKLEGEKEEVLPFELVWHAMTPHVTFFMKPIDSMVGEIYCEFTCYQKKLEKQKANLKIAEEMTMDTSPLSTCTEYPEQELINEIIILMDPTKDGNCGDWRDLAERFGCDSARIKWLETQSSPTRLLIDLWLAENNSLSQLSPVMLEINRPDVADEINKRYPSATAIGGE